MDLIDRKIIAALQADATLSVAQIADQVALSQTPCWNASRNWSRAASSCAGWRLFRRRL